MTGFTYPRALKIGDVSRQAGVNVVTIRYYERIGIMPQPYRSPGGSRLYDADASKRLAFIKRAREFGFSLDQIRALLELVDAGAPSCGEVHTIASAHLLSVREKLAGLRRLERVLAAMVAECDRGDVPDCPVIDALHEPA